MTEKKRILPILVAMLIGFAIVPMMSAAVYADDTVVTVDGVKYSLHDDDMTAVVTGHSGSFPKDITILDVIEHEGAEYVVTRIGVEAFQNAEELESVMFMPGSKLEVIDSAAFYRCSNLRDITIPAGVKEIGMDAFEHAGLKSITFLKGSKLEVIGDNAFLECDKLESITIPASTKKIGENAFHSSGLKSVSIERPSRLEVIDDQAFINCTHLASIMLPASITEVDYCAFAYCNNLNAVHYLGTQGEWVRIAHSEWDGSTSINVHNVHFVKHRITKATPETYGEEKTYCPDCDQYNATTAIEKPELFTLSAASYTYDGSEKTPDVTVTDSANGIIDAANYDVTYSGNVDAGTATATVTFKGDYYAGSKDLPFGINAKSITPAVTLSASSYTYNGKVKTPGVTVKDGTKALVRDTDYTVGYSNNTRVGKASAKVTMKGNYKGSKTATFKILPKKAGVSKAVPGKKQVKVTMSTKVASTGGTVYQIQYRMKGAAKWKTTTTKDKTKTIKKLKTGKQYQIKVRAYKSVGGTKYYGAWSKVKTTKKVK